MYLMSDFFQDLGLELDHITAQSGIITHMCCFPDKLDMFKISELTDICVDIRQCPMTIMQTTDNRGALRLPVFIVTYHERLYR